MGGIGGSNDLGRWYCNSCLKFFSFLRLRMNRPRQISRPSSSNAPKTAPTTIPAICPPVRPRALAVFGIALTPPVLDGFGSAVTVVGTPDIVVVNSGCRLEKTGNLTP